MTDVDIVRRILLAEGINGEYTNDPDDAGGPTRWGITIPVLEAFLGSECTWEDIYNLERKVAEQIYITNFIRPFDGVADSVRVNAIDMGVNAGVKRGVILLQQAMGVEVDGRVGPKTRRESSVRDWNTLYTGVRLAYYETLIVSKPRNVKWRRGWRNRALSFVDRRLMMQPRLIKIGKPIFGPMAKAA